MIEQYRYVTINETTYAYTIQGEGIPLVLLHGFTGSSETWSPYLEKWREHFQVITIDLPGHGKTFGNMEKSMKHVADDFINFLKHLQLEKVHLLGYSLGGRTALSIAMYYPECILSLILESASPGIRDEAERERRRITDVQLANTIVQDGLANFVAHWENIPLFFTQKRLPMEIQEKIREERLKQNKKGLASSLRHMGTGVQPAWWDALHRLTFPVLLIVGEFDEKFVAIGKRMVEELPDVKLKVVKNAGHAIHVEQVEKFDKIVREFIV